MKCMPVRFPTYVIGSRLAEVVEIENTGISNQDDKVVRQGGLAKLDIEIKSDWLLICFTFVTKSSGKPGVRTNGNTWLIYD